MFARVYFIEKVAVWVWCDLKDELTQEKVLVSCLTPLIYYIMFVVYLQRGGMSSATRQSTEMPGCSPRSRAARR